MKVRRPPLSFTGSLPHWADNAAFAHAFNAASTTLPHLEPYLNRVMRQAQSALGDGHAALKADITLFIGQESNHYRLHRRYNEVLHRHYPELPDLEKALADDFERFLRSRSPKFNCAYAEGFESLGIIYAEFLFERADDLLAGADPAVAGLWRWHLAEEFEHRSVCHDVYKALFGGYFYRLYGVGFALWHLMGYGNRVAARLHAADAAGLDDDARRARRRTLAAYQGRLLRFALPRLLRILSPFYDPARVRLPRGSDTLLASLDAA
jgi:predicted metal-dependent hydrolase